MTENEALKLLNDGFELINIKDYFKIRFNKNTQKIEIKYSGQKNVDWWEKPRKIKDYKNWIKIENNLLDDLTDDKNQLKYPILCEVYNKLGHHKLALVKHYYPYHVGDIYREGYKFANPLINRNDELTYCEYKESFDIITKYDINIKQITIDGYKLL